MLFSAGILPVLLPLLSGAIASIIPQERQHQLNTNSFGDNNNGTDPLKIPHPLAYSIEGPRIYGSYNEIDDNEMHQAIACIHNEICVRRNIPFDGKVRCTIGYSVAYICNWKDKKKGSQKYSKAWFAEKTGKLPMGSLFCDQSEMYEAWKQIRIARHSQTGWWYDKDGYRTFGFDRSCPKGECDNGWRNGYDGEQCHKNKHKPAPWTFDYKARQYKFYNHSAPFPQLPRPEDYSQPQYFNPWIESGPM
ncbi:hypothetical protein V8F33_013476 [Rhypophila sp. PSN 637]